MGRRQFILRRGGTLYYRRKFPVALQDVTGKEFKKSLKTGDLRVAEPAILAAHLEYAEEVKRARGPAPVRTAGRPKAATPEAAAVYPTPYPRKLADLADEELYEIVERWYAASMLRPPSLPDTQDKRVEALREARQDHAALSLGNYRELSTGIKPTADRLLIQSGIVPDPKDARYPDMLQLVARGYAARAEFEAAYYAGDIAPVLSDRFFAEIVHGTPAVPRRRQEAQRTFGMLLDEYLRHRATMNLGPRTRRDEQSISRLLRDLVGNNTNLARIDFQVCQGAKERLMQLPPKSREKYPNTSLEDIPARARADGLAPMSKKTANKYVDFLSAAFVHAKVRLRWVRENPAQGLRFKLKKADTEKYRPFTIEQLNKMFSAPLYTGCANPDRGYHRPGSCIPRESGRYWVPLIALFTGMRLNEICQLDTADIGKLDGVDVIHVREESETAQQGTNNKRLKTEASHRSIPIHPELKKLGLLEFVAKRRKRNEQKLFPDLRVGADKYYSDAFQKWFSRFLEKVGVKDRRVSFHSFRHTFRDATRRARIDVEIVNAIAGWTANSMAERYGGGVSAKKLLKEIGRVKYSGLHLPQ